MHPLSWHTGSNGCSSEKARVNRGRWPNTSMRWRHSSENKRKQRQHFANAFQGLHPRLPHWIGPCAGTPDQPGMPLDRPGSTGAAWPGLVLLEKFGSGKCENFSLGGVLPAAVVDCFQIVHGSVAYLFNRSFGTAESKPAQLLTSGGVKSANCFKI